MRRTRYRQSMTGSTVLTSLLIVLSTSALGQNGNLRMFEAGKKLIEFNCVVCRNGSKADLEHGVELVNNALRGGFGDKVAALTLLADAYNNLSTYSERNPTEQRKYFELERDTYQNLSKLEPANPKHPYRYAQVGVELGLSNEELLSEYRLALAADPKYPPAHFAVGTVLVKLGRQSEGIAELRSAFAGADSTQISIFGRKLAQVLRSAGQPSAAVAIEREMEKRLHAAGEK